jgi:hypothetical protein
MRVTIGHLKSENLDLRRSLVEALAQIRLLETKFGSLKADAGAPSMLAALNPVLPTADGEETAQSH